MICLSGALQPGQDLGAADLPHLHAAVRAGWAGLLACRADGPTLPLQLLGLPATGMAPEQTLPDRCAIAQHAHRIVLRWRSMLVKEAEADECMSAGHYVPGFCHCCLSC